MPSITRGSGSDGMDGFLAPFDPSDGFFFRGLLTGMARDLRSRLDRGQAYGGIAIRPSRKRRLAASWPQLRDVTRPRSGLGLAGRSVPRPSPPPSRPRSPRRAAARW